MAEISQTAVKRIRRHNPEASMTTLDKAGPVAHVADIQYHGEKMILPTGMSIPDAVELLKRRQEYLEEKVEIREDFDVFPWDGAHAVNAVFIKKFGWSPSTATPGFFGPNPPKLISIDVGFGKKAKVPWGAFSLPGVDGLLHCSVCDINGRMGFQLVGQVLRKDEATIQSICDDVREYLKTNSIYRGKAIKIRFRDDDGDKRQMAEISFLDTDSIDPQQLIYSRQVEEAIETNLFTPIRRVADIMNNNMPVKRGILLGGTYGTGKTLAAHVASKIAVEAGITYLYVPRADELADAIEFAKQYQSPACVVFCEDVDRVMQGERNTAMDDILNIIDGIDTKRAHIITVLTTNAMEAINPAMLRPGRLDAVIEVKAPDAEAIGRLIRMYGGDSVDKNANFTAIGELLKGNIPAVVEEVVRRSKLAQLALTPIGQKLGIISEAALVSAAQTMAHQLDLLRTRSEKKKIPLTLDGMLTDMIERAVSDPNGAAIRVASRENARV